MRAPSMFALLAGMTGASVLAQASDPTRPPAAWTAAQTRGAGGQQAAAEGGASTVQVLVTGPTRRFAMVDGHAVRLGETYNGARLVAINSDGVVWQREGGRETASMSPGIQKRIKGDPAAKPTGSKRKKPIHGEGQ